MTTRVTQKTLPAYRVWRKTGQIFIDSPSTVIEEIRYFSPTSQRRHKPADLFANQTDYDVSSSIMSTTLGIWTDANDTHYVPGLYGYSIVGEGTYALSQPFDVGGFADLDLKARGKIKDQNVNLAQSLGEYKQTADLFLGTARDVIKVFRSVRSGRAITDFSRIMTRPRNRQELALSNRWLELQYGWKPLMSDVYGSAEQLAKVVREGVTKHVTVRDTAKAKRFFVVGTTSGSESLTTEELFRVVKCRYVIGDSGLKQLSEVGITNPAAVAWELIPWSFVIDWFINVGEFLNGLDALVGVQDLKVNRAFSNLREHHASWIVNSATIQRPWCTKKLIRRRRFATTNFLQYGTPSYQPKIGPGKIANAIGLLRQQKR